MEVLSNLISLYIILLINPQLQVLCSYLERDPSQTLHKGRNSSLLPVLSWSLLMTAYKKHENWPEVFVRVYVKDAISDRIWIENPMCKQYCNEIAKVFGTVKPATISPTSAIMGPAKPDSDPIGKYFVRFPTLIAL